MIYILSVITCGKGLTLEYRIVEAKKDLRRTFCKKHDSDIYNGSIIELFRKIQSCGAKIKGNRLIMPDAKAAYNFQKWLKYKHISKNY